MATRIRTSTAMSPSATCAGARCCAENGPRPIVDGGARRSVCELCTSRALHGGWIREGTLPEFGESTRGLTAAARCSGGCAHAGASTPRAGDTSRARGRPSLESRTQTVEPAPPARLLRAARRRASPVPARVPRAAPRPTGDAPARARHVRAVPTSVEHKIATAVERSSTPQSTRAPSRGSPARWSAGASVLPVEERRASSTSSSPGSCAGIATSSTSPTTIRRCKKPPRAMSSSNSCRRSVAPMRPSTRPAASASDRPWTPCTARQAFDAARRPSCLAFARVIYCVVPEALADELLPKLTDYYADDPNVTVIVDRRRSSRRAWSRWTQVGGKREVRDRRRPRIPGELPELATE